MKKKTETPSNSGLKPASPSIDQIPEKPKEFSESESNTHQQSEKKSEITETPPQEKSPTQSTNTQTETETSSPSSDSTNTKSPQSIEPSNQYPSKSTNEPTTISQDQQPKPPDHTITSQTISLQKETDHDMPAPSKRKKLQVLLAIIIIFILISTATYILLFSKSTFLSPVPNSSNSMNILSFETSSTNPKQVIGFLPFWNMKEEKNIRYNLLTQIAYFAIEIDQDGNIHKIKEDGTQEPGWTGINSPTMNLIIRKAKESRVKVILTIQSMDQESIESLVNDSQKRNRAIIQTLEVLEAKNLDGINVDFEYAGTPTNSTTKNFTVFLKELNNAMKEMNENLTLSVDVFADASQKVRIWEIKEIANLVDHIIIMGYDFHRPSSTKAGPIAPLRGSPENWQYDITTTLSGYLKQAPPDKIILGVPYYGYEWHTTTEEPYATTFPNTGALASYNRIQSLIQNKSPNLDWDEIAFSPRITYQEGGKIMQVYYENESSLGLKYDLIYESGIAGIAIWALGYDGEYPNLWNLLNEKFFSSSSSAINN